MADQRFVVQALRVRQWLRAWDNVDYKSSEHRSKPEPHFYLMGLEVGLLKRLANVRRREVGDGTRTDQYAIQRRHDPDRSEEIADYVSVGYPWSELGSTRRKSAEFRNLRKPGWLPTALVVNILGSNDRRNQSRVAAQDVIKIGRDVDGIVELELPSGSRNPAWRPTLVAPIEVIDGQHRLWAFTEAGLPETFELPVVAYHSLDISWQAYLFYTINIKPKKINRSLAFDLYPLLRTEEWLESIEGAGIYRETRAQEITETLWSHPSSIWKGRINMLGEPGKSGVTQAAWIRSLTASFIKGWDGRGRRIGGLYGTPVGADRLALPWSRAQQAALLILIWHEFGAATNSDELEWVEALAVKRGHPMFAGSSLINTDVGVRAILQMVNDAIWLQTASLKLHGWTGEPTISETLDLAEVTRALSSLSEEPVAEYVQRLAKELSTFDWRSASAPGLSDEARVQRMALRGSGGYGELRRLLVAHLRKSKDPEFRDVGERIAVALGMRDAA